MDIALVHGSYHGAWCWEFLTPELERLGHRVITMDLPIGDPSLGAAAYADAVEAALPADSEPVLVGTSMSGSGDPHRGRASAGPTTHLPRRVPAGPRDVGQRAAGGDQAGSAWS